VNFSEFTFISATFRGFPLDLCNDKWTQKTRMMGIPFIHSFIRFFNENNVIMQRFNNMHV